MSEQRISAELRQQVTEHADGNCEYCRSQARYATQPFSVEHIIARAKRGPTTLENLALACQGCNNHKYDKVAAPDPVSDDRAALPSTPRSLAYSLRLERRLHVDRRAHAKWTRDSDHSLLNRDGVVNLRPDLT